MITWDYGLINALSAALQEDVRPAYIVCGNGSGSGVGFEISMIKKTCPNKYRVEFTLIVRVPNHEYDREKEIISKITELESVQLTKQGAPIGHARCKAQAIAHKDNGVVCNMIALITITDENNDDGSNACCADASTADAHTIEDATEDTADAIDTTTGSDSHAENSHAEIGGETCTITA